MNPAIRHRAATRRNCQFAAARKLTMSQARIDLSKLPDDIRRRLEERLNALPAEVRQKLVAKLSKVPAPMLAEMLARGTPMLDKILGGLERSGTAAASAPVTAAAKSASAAAGTFGKSAAPKATQVARGLYNNTVQRGDRLALPLGVIVLVIGGLFLVLYRAGLLG